MAEQFSSAGAALAAAIRAARSRLGDPLARVAIVSTARTTVDQLARSLADEGGFLGVVLLPAAQIITDIGRPAMREAGWSPEPAGWMAAALAEAIPRLDEAGALGAFGETLRQPGWRGPLGAGLKELEAAGVTPAALRAAGEAAGDSDRAGLLAALLQAIQARRAEERVYAGRQLEMAAQLRLELGATHAYDDVHACVVVGDMLLSPSRCAALRRFFDARDTTRLAIPPLEQLPPAPHGLREAAASARVIEVDTSSTGVGHLQRHLFTPTRTPGPGDDTVQLVATPDEVREVVEAVREVLRAIRRRVPLDRIAVVLPDATCAEPLERAFERAGIPTTWLTAAPLSRARPARFLALALEIADRGGAPARWYQLLTQPGLEGIDTTGAVRWRDLLADAPAAPERLDDWLDVAASDEDPRRANAASALRASVRQLSGDLAGLPRRGTLGEHGRAWQALLERYWTPDRTRGRVLRALDTWGDGALGAKLPLATATALLSEQLDATPALSGSLDQRTVRILPPMQALGGDYNLICVTGLVEGRFPRRVEESPVLPEALRATLAARGFPLIDQAARRDIERRRLAAVISGCAGTLWLSTPRADLLEGRPQLPSALLLEIASALEGARVPFQILAERLLIRGHRSRPAPAPEDALDPAERRIASAASDPEGTLDALLADPTTWRLLRLHRAIDALYAGGPPDAWTGLVDPSLLPLAALEGEPLDAVELADLVLDPSGFFQRRVLGLRRARALRQGPRISWHTLRQRAVEVLREVAGEADPRAAFTARWREHLAAWGRDQGGLEPAELEVLVELGQRQFEVMERAGVARLDAPRSTEGAPVHPDLPLRVRVEAANTHGAHLLDWSRKAAIIKPDKRGGLRLLLEAAALAADGQPIGGARQVGLDGSSRTANLSRHREAIEAQLAAAHDRATRGWWPMRRLEDPLALGRERTDTLDLEETP